MENVKDLSLFKEKKLAEEIIRLDLERDALFEELIVRLGCQAHDFLRKIQNGY